MERKCFWNTFVTVDRGQTFLDMLYSSVPEAIDSLRQARSPRELESAYPLLPSVDFSRDVLVHQSHRLLTLRDQNSGWADLGSPDRLFETLARNGIQPEWDDRTPASTAHNLSGVCV